MALLVISTFWDVSGRDGIATRMPFIINIFQRVFPESYLLAPSGNDDLVFTHEDVCFTGTYYYRNFVRGYCLGFFTDFNPFFHQQLKRIMEAHPIDTVYIPYHWGVHYIKKHFPHVKILHETLGFEQYFVLNVAKTYPYLIRFLLSKYIGLFEKRALEDCDVVISVGDVLKRQLAAYYGVSKSKFLPLKVGIDFTKPTKAEGKSKDLLFQKFELDPSKKYFIFHGGLDHPPNLESATLIVEKIAPVLWERDKSVAFCVVGRGNERMSYKNVCRYPFIDILDEIMRCMTGAIMPILSGSGNRTKIIDYVKNHLPMVSTKLGMEGNGFTRDDIIITPNEIGEEFFEGILKIAHNPDYARTLEQHCYQSAKRIFGASTLTKILRERLKRDGILPPR